MFLSIALIFNLFRNSDGSRRSARTPGRFAGARRQHERAFRKQKSVSLNSKQALKLVKTGGRKPRWVRNPGLGFKIPRAAFEGTYIDKKCPFTGDVSIRGRILKGLVISKKMKNTIVIRRHYLHFVPKYNRFEKRYTNMSVHCSPAFDVKVGDVVTVGECRPLAKTVCFNVLSAEAKEIFGNPRKVFRLF